MTRAKSLSVHLTKTVVVLNNVTTSLTASDWSISQTKPPAGCLNAVGPA